MKLSTTNLTILLAILCNGSVAFIPTAPQRSMNKIELEMARKPFISGNWKLNPQTKTEAIQLGADIAAAVTPSTPESDVALFVPYPFLDSVISNVGDKILIGGEVRTYGCRTDHRLFVQ